MRAEAVYPAQAELSMFRAENRVRVENQDGVVVIRALRENFSPHEKACCIRYLAAEGYIPDYCQRGDKLDLDRSGRVTWIAEA